MSSRKGRHTVSVQRSGECYSFVSSLKSRGCHSLTGILLSSVVVYALILALAAQTPALADSVEDTLELLETAVGLLKPWAAPGSGIECGLEIISSVHRKQRLRSHHVDRASR
jgi:hypothetical protein